MGGWLRSFSDRANKGTLARLISGNLLLRQQHGGSIIRQELEMMVENDKSLTAYT